MTRGRCGRRVARIVGGGVSWISGPSASPVGSWTHVALTYDGSQLRLFVNGVQVASAAASGAIQASSSPLWIGGNQPYGEYFNGLIDDVRVYNRALTQAEIQTDMATPLGGAGGSGYGAAVGADEFGGDCGGFESGESVVDGVDGQRRGDGVSGGALPGRGCTNFAQVGDADGHDRSATRGWRRRRATATGCGRSTRRGTWARIRRSSARRRRRRAIRRRRRRRRMLAATAVSRSQVNLSWTASTDNVGVTGYRVERCPGPAARRSRRWGRRRGRVQRHGVGGERRPTATGCARSMRRGI